MISHWHKVAGITFAVMILMLLIALLTFPVYSYLSLSVPTKQNDILIVEGWLPDEALEQAKDEFLKNGYRLLITTGHIKNKGYMIGSGGKIEFDVRYQVPVPSDSNYTISLPIRSTPVKGQFAHIRLLADSAELGEGFTTRRKKTLTYLVKLGKPPETINVIFDNDTFTDKQDRNIYLYSLAVNNSEFPVNTQQVAYYYYRDGAYRLNRRFNSSDAADAAHYLIAAGIRDSLVIPVETSRKIRSKTYTSALDAKYWLDINWKSSYSSVTVFTQGLHARRSYISFRKAFGNSAEVGIIALPDTEISSSNWYKTKRGWQKTLYEAAGVLYAILVL